MLRSIDLTPWRCGCLAVVAMGANSHAGWVLVEMLRGAGRRATNVSASVFQDAVVSTVVGDCFVLASEGGRSSETVMAAKALPVGTRLGLTNTSECPLSEVVDLNLVLGHAGDSPVYTVGYTAMTLAFGLLAQALSGDTERDDFLALPGMLEGVLATSPALIGELGERFMGLDSIDFVGSGTSFASAAESALLFREATRIPAAGFETRQYLHGPMEALSRRTGCVLFGDGREIELAGYLAERSIPVLLVTSCRIEARGTLSVIVLPPVKLASRAVLEIGPLQLVAGAVAQGRGLDVDGFRYHQDDTKLPE